MTPSTLHDDAMTLADLADRYHAAGLDELARSMLTAAADLDRRAAALETTEPSRGILHRSAAWLALQAGYPGTAAVLARAGLAGAPCGRVANELREVLDAATRAGA